MASSVSAPTNTLPVVRASGHVSLVASPRILGGNTLDFDDMVDGAYISTNQTAVQTPFDFL